MASVLLYGPLLGGFNVMIKVLSYNVAIGPTSL